ncbi:MAG: hypothetical protein EB141_21515, partial [Verrucomicrobia bacterium]|nr:hypothetical protein [Verrucomicrobiota bacterium]
QLDGVAEDLIDEADDACVLGGAVQIVIARAFLHDFEAGFFVERADGVRADAEMFLRRVASPGGTPSAMRSLVFICFARQGSEPRG